MVFVLFNKFNLITCRSSTLGTGDSGVTEVPCPSELWSMGGQRSLHWAGVCLALLLAWACSLTSHLFVSHPFPA